MQLPLLIWIISRSSPRSNLILRVHCSLLYGSSLFYVDWKLFLKKNGKYGFWWWKFSKCDSVAPKTIINYVIKQCRLEQHEQVLFSIIFIITLQVSQGFTQTIINAYAHTQKIWIREKIAKTFFGIFALYRTGSIFYPQDCLWPL